MVRQVPGFSLSTGSAVIGKSHAERLDAPSRPAAHAEYLRSHDALVGRIAHREQNNVPLIAAHPLIQKEVGQMLPGGVDRGCVVTDADYDV